MWLGKCLKLRCPRGTRLWRCYGTGVTAATAAAQPSRLGIIGVPFSKGQGKGGVELAPDLLREHKLVELLQGAAAGNLLVHDYGNLRYEVAEDLHEKQRQHFAHIKHFAEFMACNRALIGKVQEVLRGNEQFLTVGGDHAIGFGSVAGHLRHTPNLSLVWIDAHADINLHSTSDSGNIHGMPVSCLLAQLREHWQHADLHGNGAPNCLPADQLVYVGLRDIDPSEAYILNKLGIRAYAMDSVDRYGIHKVIEMVLDALNPGNKIHVSFDIDALDRREAPSTGTAVLGGLTLREAISIVEALRDTQRVQGVDLVEVNPRLGSAQDVSNTVACSLEILKTIFGHKRAGNFSNVQIKL